MAARCFRVFRRSPECGQYDYSWQDAPAARRVNRPESRCARTFIKERDHEHKDFRTCRRASHCARRARHVRRRAAGHDQGEGLGADRPHDGRGHGAVLDGAARIRDGRQDIRRHQHPRARNEGKGARRDFRARLGRHQSADQGLPEASRGRARHRKLHGRLLPAPRPHDLHLAHRPDGL